jgi:hypothetical protein
LILYFLLIRLENLSVCLSVQDRFHVFPSLESTTRHLQVRYPSSHGRRIFIKIKIYPSRQEKFFPNCFLFIYKNIFKLRTAWLWGDLQATKEFISITTFTCQFCHSGLSRILLFSERFPTSGNDRRGFTYGLISKSLGILNLPSYQVRMRQH